MEESNKPRYIYLVFLYEQFVGMHFKSAHATEAGAEKFVADNAERFINDESVIKKVKVEE